MTVRSLGDTFAEQVDEIFGSLCDAHARLLESGNLLRCGTRGTGDDRARVAHATSRRRRLAGDESDDRLLHVLFHEASCLLFVGTADLSHHGDGIRTRIRFERGETIDEVR